MAEAVLLKGLGDGIVQDQFGNALNSRQVYVYQRGTTTQVQVYSDSGLTQAMTQPLTTGGDGVQGGIPGYIASLQSVDFVDVLTGNRTQAEAINATGVVVDQSADSTSAISVASGSRNRGLRDFVSLMDYAGMDSTGATDVTTLVQAALNTGLDVYRPPGTYQLSSVSFAANGQHFWGPGNITQKANVVAHCVLIGSNLSDCLYTGGTITGNNYLSGNFGIQIKGLRNGITHTTVTNTSSHGIVLSGQHTDSPQTAHCFAQNCRVFATGAMSRGIHIFGDDAGGGATFCSITDNHVSNTGEASISYTGCTHCLIANNVCENSGFQTTEDGITGYDAFSSDIAIIGNVITNTNNHGIHAGGSHLMISGNEINTVAQTGILVQQAPNAAPSSAAVASVTGNTIYACAAGDGISVGNYSDVTVTGNVIDTLSTIGTHGIQVSDSSQGTHPKGFAITGNQVSNVTGEGIRIQGVNEFTCNGNIITNSGDIGIKVLAPASSQTVDTGIIAGNTIASANTASIALAATSTINNVTVGINAYSGSAAQLSLTGGSFLTNTTVLLDNPAITQTVVGSAAVTIPTGANHAEVTLVGGGGGGGSGGTPTSSINQAGGGGGGSGEFITQFIPLSGVSALVLTVGDGGAGGGTTAANGNVGAAGTNGSNSTLSGVGLTTITAYGGSGGSGASASTTTGGAGGLMGASATGSRSAPGTGTSPGAGGIGQGAGNTAVGWSGGGGGGGGAATSTNGGGGGNPGGTTAGGTAGGSGGSGTVNGVAGNPGSTTTFGAGGGGGGGGATSGGTGGAGGKGSPGYGIIKWYP